MPRARPVHVLWYQARDEHPHDAARRSERLRELMREEGHIVAADHPDAGAKVLPCGWPVKSA